MTLLTLKSPIDAPLEAAVISPDRFAGKTVSEIASLPVTYGNRQAILADFFEIRSNGTTDIIMDGDMSRVKSIASGMTKGKVAIHGNAGMHLGSYMKGGEIEVQGDADDWAGAEMTGGMIRIHGNAGHGLGGAYRGSRRGMNRGLIAVDGNAGNEAGSLMRRGLIVIGGDAGDFTGAFMIAGTVIVLGNSGVRSGAGMLRGSIITYKAPELLPTFRYDCNYRPDFLNLIFRSLLDQGVPIPDYCFRGSFRRYSGDLNRLGKGEILVYDQR